MIIKQNNTSYDLYLKLIAAFSQDGFKAFAADNPLLRELEELTEKCDQFFYLVDAIDLNILFSSKRCVQIVGKNPDELNFYHIYEITHSQDIHRLSLGRAKLMKLAHDIFVAEKGYGLLSTNHLMRNPSGNYSNVFLQVYMFYSAVPHKSAYFLKIHTNIHNAKKDKHGFHYYIGTNLLLYRH